MAGPAGELREGFEYHRKDDQRAVMLRGRGFALIELGRLDEAEKAYRDSLNSEPNNARALNELTYIGRLRAGGPTAPSALSTSKPQ
jgi:Flp pilus assembly protein TadD